MAWRICPHCGVRYRVTNFMKRHGEDWPDVHQARCRKETPAARAYYAAHGRWPRKCKTLAEVEISLVPVPPIA